MKDEGRDLHYVCRWDNDKKQDYLDALNSDSVLECISVIKNQLCINEVTNENELNGNVNEFYTLFSGVFDPLFKWKFSSKGEIFKENTKQQNWFDDSCHAKCSNFYNLLNIYRKNKNDENRHNMTHARTEYKGCIRKAKYAFDKLQTNKLENARLKNAKEYWKLLKRTCSQTKSKSLTSDIFADYFKAINDPNDLFFFFFFQPDEDVLLFNDRYLSDVQ